MWSNLKNETVRLPILRNVYKTNFPCDDFCQVMNWFCQLNIFLETPSIKSSKKCIFRSIFCDT